MLRSTMTAVLFLLLPAPAFAQLICEDDFVDPVTGHPTHLEVLVASPADGLEIDHAVFAPDCGRAVEVSGIASTIGIPPRIDFYLVIDTSGSTSGSSQVDLNGDGRDDSILEAELVAAEAFIEAVDLVNNRVALLRFGAEASIVAALTQDRAELDAGLGRLRSQGPDGGTNYGAAIELAVGHHDALHDPTREQVILFLSDGEPTVAGSNPPLAGLDPCPTGHYFNTDSCPGVYWSDFAQRNRGIRVETFAVGAWARAEVLLEMADRGAGNFTRVAVAGDVARVLPEVVLVGVAEVRVKNLDTLEEVVAELTPDGSYNASIGLLPGINDLLITAVSDHDESWSVGCERRVTLACASYECPEPQLHDCEDGWAMVESLRPWTSHQEIEVASEHDSDGDGDAGGVYPLGLTEVEFLLTDIEGNERVCTTFVEVVDGLPPELLGVPEDLDLECTEALPDPAAVTADDLCHPDPPVVFTETETALGCPADRDLLRSWSTTDDAGHSAEASRLIRVRDTQGPVVHESDEDLHCFRAANHWMLELGRADFAPEITDACSEIAYWVLTGCESGQPDDDRGDGHTVNDCSVSPDGESLLVRGERDGRAKEGRRYAVSAMAMDACGNWSEPARIGFIRILHDLREGQQHCQQVPKAGARR